MKIRFPLYAKILLWFFANLLLIAAAFFAIFHAQLRFGLDTLIAGGPNARIEAVRDVIASELRGAVRPKWNAVLTRFDNAYHLQFFIFRRDGTQLAGAQIALPEEIRAKLAMPPPRPPLDDPRFEPPPEAPRPPPPPDPHFQKILHSSHPTRYWMIEDLRLPDGEHRGPLALVIASESLSGGGLFFDPKPLLIAAASALIFSILFWLPLVGGITRSLSLLTEATKQIAAGRFDVSVPENRRDELGALGAAVNRMAARLAGFVSGQKRFLGDTAHELCTPIARMQMALGILETRAAENQLGYVADVQEELQHISSLVNELLSFSKATLNASEIKLQPIALRDLVENAVAREAADDVKIRVDIAENLRVMGEPKLLLRSVANLIRNAIRYAAAAGPIVISATRAGDEISLAIADSGPGIPPNSLAQIFDPFFRIDVSRNRETGGVGLGLAIVKTCVESCGGTVTAHNRETGGLEITLRLQAA